MSSSDKLRSAGVKLVLNPLCHVQEIKQKKMHKEKLKLNLFYSFTFNQINSN